MSDKIEQIFSDQNQQGFPFDEDLDREKTDKRRSRIRNRHRLIGLAAIVLLAVAVAPAVFRPAYESDVTKARTNIPAASEQKLVTQVELNAQKAKKASEEQALAQMSGEKVAKSLSSSDNMVRPNTRPTEQKSAETKARPAQTRTESKPAQVKGANQTAGSDSRSKDAARSAQGVSANAAAAIDDPMGNTIARLQAEPLSLKPIQSVADGRYYIQVVATSNKAAAAVKKDLLSKLKLPAYMQVVKYKNTDLWSVRVGRFATQAQAAQALKRMNENGIKGFIVQPKDAPQAKKTK